MSGIGGYITFGLHREKPLKPGAIALNTGRNALECLLRIRGYRVLHAPKYTCDVLRPSIDRAGVELRFYDIDAAFEPLINASAIGGEEALLYTNYFGLKDETVQRLALECPTLIVDQAQAFYAETPKGVDAFYSAHKFFSIPDGAFLYLNGKFDQNLEQDSSTSRVEHLLMGSDQGVESGYTAFHNLGLHLAALPPRFMSRLSSSMLNSLDHAGIRERRQANHAQLHAALAPINELSVDPRMAMVPMAYPLLTAAPDLRSKLIRAGVYIGAYWPNTLGELEANSPGAIFSERLVCLPVDQRQSPKEMEQVITLIQSINRF